MAIKNDVDCDESGGAIKLYRPPEWTPLQTIQLRGMDSAAAPNQACTKERLRLRGVGLSDDPFGASRIRRHFFKRDRHRDFSILYIKFDTAAPGILDYLTITCRELIRSL